MTALDSDAFVADDSAPLDAHREGASHVLTPNGMIPIEQWQADQRKRLEQQPAPPPPAPPQRPDRAKLAADLDAARARRAETLAKLRRADTTLARAVTIADAAKRALELVDAEFAARNERFTDKIRDWIAAGGVGEKPRAKRLTADETERRAAAEAELRAANGAITALESELAEAQRHDDAARADLYAAAREVLAEDAADLAARIDELETQAAELWHQLWAHAFASPGGVALKLDALARGVVAAAPNKTGRANIPLARRTAEGQKAIADVRARFNVLVAGPA
jgi:hypothetical protein